MRCDRDGATSGGMSAVRTARTARFSCSLGAAAAGMVCPSVLPPLQQRGGDGHFLVREKGEGEEKRQVKGREEEARQNEGGNRHGRQAGVIGVACCFYERHYV